MRLKHSMGQVIFFCAGCHILASTKKQQQQQKPTTQKPLKQFLNQYLHKGDHKIQCFCILCYVTVQFCVLYYTVWLQDFCAL